VNESAVQLTIEIAVDQDSDETELGRTSQQLRQDLLRLDVDNVVRAPAAQAPLSAKGGETGISNILILTLSNSTVLVAIVGTLGAWIKRRGGRRVRVRLGTNEIEIEIDNASAEEQAKLIESWINRRLIR
jgi:hypothetical protein